MKTFVARFALFVVMAAWALPASAQVTWTGGSGSGSNWNDAANWSALPGATGSALVFAGTQRTVSSNDLVTAATTLTFSNDGTAGRTGAFSLSGNAITLGGNISTTSSGTDGIAISDTIALDLVLNATRTLTLGTTHDLTITGLISKSVTTANINKASTGVLTLTNTANSFSQLVINNGPVKVTQIGTSGSPSQTGTAVTINMGFSTSTGSILYVGSAGSPETTNKRIQIGTTPSNAAATGAATLISDGGNAIQFTNTQFNTLHTGATAPRTLTLSGSNAGDNLISGTIADNSASAPISVTKSGAGRWILAGTNTFTGQTSVAGGSLIVRGGSAISNSGTVAVSGGTFQLDSSETIGRLDLIGAGTVAVTSGSTATLTAATYVASLTSGTAVISAPLGGASSGFTMSGAGGTVVLAGINTYGGATTVQAGTLLVNGTNSGAGSLTVNAGATLGGSGQVDGAALISGLHSPGNSPGLQSFGSSLDYASGASVLWELTSNTVTGRGTAYDGIDVTGNLTFSGPTSLLLDFDNTSTVDWQNSFWAENHEWLLYGVAGTTANAGNFSISGSDWLDGFGRSFATERPGSSFAVQQSEGSQNVVLVYTAVPEPAAGVLAVVGVALWAAARRRGTRERSP